MKDKEPVLKRERARARDGDVWESSTAGTSRQRNLPPVRGTFASREGLDNKKESKKTKTKKQTKQSEEDREAMRLEKIPMAQRRVMAQREKDKGNESYKAKDFMEVRET